MGQCYSKNISVVEDQDDCIISVGGRANRRPQTPSSYSVNGFLKESSSVPPMVTWIRRNHTLMLSLVRFNPMSFSTDRIIIAITIWCVTFMTSLTQVENTIEQAEEVGSGVLGFTQRVLEVVIDTLKPGVDVALPLLQKAGDQALKIATPAFS